MSRSTSSVVAELSLRLHDDGALEIAGNIADKRLAQSMLDAARAAIVAQPEGRGLVVPARDVCASQDARYPLVAVGDR